MIDVKSVIDGTFQAHNLVEALEVFVVVQDLQEQVDKGKATAFGYVREQAVVIYATWYERRESLNDPDNPWYAMAAAEFENLAGQALAAGELKEYSSKQIAGFKQAVRTLRLAMQNEAPLIDAQGGADQVLTGKTAIEQFNKKVQADRERAEHEARVQAIRDAGYGPEPVESSEGQAETGGGQASDLDVIENEAVRALATDIIMGLAELCSHTEQDPDDGETGPEKAEALASGWVRLLRKKNKKFSSVVEAAQAEAKRTGTDG